MSGPRGLGYFAVARSNESPPCPPIAVRVADAAQRRNPVTRQFPLRIAIVYGALSALWMAGSNWLAVHVFPDHMASLMTATVWVFVGLTAGLLFLLLQREARRLHAVENRLAESEKRLRETFEQAAIGIAHVALDGRFLRVNPELCTMLGYAADDLIRVRFHDLTHPDDLADTVKSAEDLLAGRIQAYAKEKRYIRKDGSTVWGNINVSLVRTEAGAPEYFVATIDEITKRKRAETVLERERQFIHAVLHSISDGVLVCDAAGEITLFNRAFGEFHGLDTSDLGLASGGKRMHGSRLYDDIVPGMAKDDLPLFRALRGERVQNVEMTIAPRNRPARSVLVNAEPMVDGEGRSLGAVAVVRDISERVKAEASRREREAHLRAIMDNAPASIVFKDLDGRSLLANQLFLDRYRLDAAEAVGKTAYDISDRASADEITAQERLVMASGRPQAFELVRNFDGVEQIFMVFRFPVMAEDGKPLGVGSIAVDITESKQSERALAASERRLALALRATNDGLWDWDLTTGRAFFSERYKSILGYGFDEFPDSYVEFRDRVHPDDRERVEAVIAEFHATTRDRFEEEFRMRHKDGHFVNIVSRGYLMRDEAGKAVRLTGTHTDVTELRAVQAQLVQANKLRAVGQLAGGTAHDFNNLLQVIQSSIELVRRKIEPGHEVQPFLASALKATERGGKLTQQLLSFSRKQMLRPESVHLAALIRGMLDLLKRTIGEDIEIRTELEDALPAVTVDPHGMENAILNIALNSRAAMPEGGTLTVRATRRQLAREMATADGALPAGLYVEIVLADTGCGMPADVIEHAFEPFFTTKEVGQGSGLGLSMVFGFAKQSGGNVTLESGVGCGTTVTILLPVANR